MYLAAGFHTRLRRVVSMRGADFVRFVHDALNLGAIRSRELRMQLHRQEVAALFSSNPTQQKQDD